MTGLDNVIMGFLIAIIPSLSILTFKYMPKKWRFEDDTKTIFWIIKVYSAIVFFYYIAVFRGF